MKLRIVAGGIFGAEGEYPVGYEFETDAEIPAGWVGRVAIIEHGACEGAQFLTGEISKMVTVDEYHAVIAERDALLAASEKEYHVGDLTMAKVFQPSGLTNLSDLQAVFDAVEAALSPPDEGASLGAEKDQAPTREAIAEMDKAEVLEWLDAHGWDGDKRLGAEKLREALAAIIEAEGE